MRLTSQETIITLTSKETGFPEELVQFVYKNFYRTLRDMLTNRVADVIKLEKFLKFKDNEKEQHVRWAGPGGAGEREIDGRRSDFYATRYSGGQELQ